MTKITFTTGEFGHTYCEVGYARIGWYYFAKDVPELGDVWVAIVNSEFLRPDMHFARSESAAKAFLIRAADEYESHPRV